MKQTKRYIFYALLLLSFFITILLKHLTTQMPTEGYYAQQTWVFLLATSASGALLSIIAIICCLIKYIKLRKGESRNGTSNKK